MDRIWRQAAVGLAALVLVGCDSEEDQRASFTSGRVAVLQDVTFGSATAPDFANAAVALPDGGFALVGQSGTRGWVLRLDAEGRLLWEQRFGDPAFRYSIFEIGPTAEGGVVLGGSRWAVDKPANAWVAALDPGGTVLWEHVFPEGGFFSEIIGLGLVGEAPGQETVVAGIDSAFMEAGTEHVLWLRRLGADRSVVWEKRARVRQAGGFDPKVFAPGGTGAGVIAGTVTATDGSESGGALRWVTEAGEILDERPLEGEDGIAVLGASWLGGGLWAVAGQSLDESARRGWYGFATPNGGIVERFTYDTAARDDTPQGADAALALVRTDSNWRILDADGSTRGGLVIAGSTVPRADGAGGRTALGETFVAWTEAATAGGAAVRYAAPRTPTARDLGGLAVNADGRVLMALNPGVQVQVGDIRVLILRPEGTEGS